MNKIIAETTLLLGLLFVFSQVYYVKANRSSRDGGETLANVKRDIKKRISDIITKAAVSDKEHETFPKSIQKVDVILPMEEIWAAKGHGAKLLCQYAISTGDDLPVTVTWKVGDGPRFATDLYTCYGYTRKLKKCLSVVSADPIYQGRVQISQNSPSLEILKVNENDNRNFWCQVSLEQGIHSEVGVDMKSVVLRVTNGGDMPKFHSVQVDENIASASRGSETKLNCTCATGYHCDDVYWYKGPTDPHNTNYELIYSRTSYAKPAPTKYQGYNDWKGRVRLSGNSLVISGLKLADSGRYWCELRSASYYGIGETATDAKSVVLKVQSENEKSSLCINKQDGFYADAGGSVIQYLCYAGRFYQPRCLFAAIFNSKVPADEQCK